jgi:hypothetical protein
MPLVELQVPCGTSEREKVGLIRYEVRSVSLTNLRDMKGVGVFFF